MGKGDNNNWSPIPFDYYTRQLDIGGLAQTKNTSAGLSLSEMFFDYRARNKPGEPDWPNYSFNSNFGEETLDYTKGEFADPSPKKLDLTDRYHRWKHTWVERVLNKGQHAVLTIVSDRIDDSILRGIIGTEKSMKLNDWVPY
jgi:hypothetical protein